jgi:hypothetical protein
LSSSSAARGTTSAAATRGSSGVAVNKTRRHHNCPYENKKKLTLLHGVSLSFENPKRGVHSERRRGRHPDERDVCGRCVGLSRPTTRRFIFRMRIFRIVPVSNVEPQTRVVNARVERVVGAACKQNTSSL